VEVALNDIVVSRGAISRLIALDVSVDGEIITRYRCDGLIVSSPTGSTAYSLAAGGAIVLPTADVFTLTPICPHALSNRSIILPLASAIHIKAASPSTILSADGQIAAELDSGDEVTIRRSRRKIRLVRMADSSFLEALRRKLHWRGAYL
jgi:NAD+ kinase